MLTRELDAAHARGDPAGVAYLEGRIEALRARLRAIASAQRLDAP